MAGILSVSRTNLAQRRQKLRRQRQLKILQAIWRTLAVTGLASVLFWVAIQPMWVLKDSGQIVIKSGGQVLTQKDIYSLLGLSSPQSLWRIEPSLIADSLRKQPNIAQATVRRRLLPPGLIIEIQERVPVAIAQITKNQRITSCVLTPSFTGKPSEVKSCLQNSGMANQQNELGLLDASGVWMPLSRYISINPKAKLPRLIVIGAIAQYKPFWTQLYEAISHSSLKVTEINFQDPTNLILKTELGIVHLGSPSNRLPEQIQALVQMRRLPNEVNPSNIDYIDIKNPAVPLVQMNQKNPGLVMKKSEPLHKTPIR
ncbi:MULTISPECIES: cell division protein FtsQ/DivIB [Nostocales]|jgi:cell division protein FtsQ|uniref:cell division protein FtsQ/DivIB n=1 Tax=Nostocales TaxID=1161 RepID=UPI00029B677C|nr:MULTISPECIES: FtsQ-type POTRA domain-containing protein [Nostocales]AFW96341.1 polypeptide-transport-associated protein FtsQ [Anabaena sp. 90]MTJ19418.1 FtsQ-type POTRA domain-containing protein [Dolichospermum sp. UHCC 0299]MTJ38839.1 FtsQ-type POTRA domain-containing protein [Dolichospermum sp. UHCC 0406]